MLEDSKVEANIPAADLQRARHFYEEKLGLTPSAEQEGVALQYVTGGGTAFNIYQTEYAGQAGHTIAQWHVTDIEGTVRGLKGRGISFERYDLPGVEWRDDIAVIPGLGSAAWFEDSEGNIMCIDQPS